MVKIKTYPVTYKGLTFQKFQFLIGKIKTILKKLQKSAKAMFQSLIGKIKTDFTPAEAYDYVRFQSLIGKIKTIPARKFNDKIPSFNPS